MATSASQNASHQCSGLSGFDTRQMRDCSARFTEYFGANRELHSALAHVPPHGTANQELVFCHQGHPFCLSCAKNAALRIAHATTLKNLEEVIHLHIGVCTALAQHPLILLQAEVQEEIPTERNFFTIYNLCFRKTRLEPFNQLALVSSNNFQSWLNQDLETTSLLRTNPPRKRLKNYRRWLFLFLSTSLLLVTMSLLLDKELPTAGEPHLCINGSRTGGFIAFCNLLATLAAMFGIPLEALSEFIPPAILNQFAAIGPNATNAWGQWAVQGCHPAIAPLYNLSIPTCFPIPPALGPITESHPVTQMLAYAWEMLAPTLAAQGIGFINGTVANVWVLKRTLASCLQIMNQGIPGVLLPGSLIRAMQIYWLDPNNVPPDVLAQLKQALQRILDLYLHQQWGPAIENFPRH